VENQSGDGASIPFLDFRTAYFEACATGTSTLISMITVNSGGAVTSINTKETLVSDTKVQIVYIGPT
jgi:hypothetical protein